MQVRARGVAQGPSANGTHDVHLLRLLGFLAGVVFWLVLKP
jgi:hypothetical protein